MLIRPLKILLYTVLAILLLLLLIVVYNYVTCPIYSFAEPKPFSGHNIYNPYKNIKGKTLIKANFHAHTAAYGGITFGTSTAEELVEIYERYGYDISSISNYQNISTYQEGKSNYIPAYEHGYNIFKFHQLNIGAKSVVWKDYPFYLSINNKQNLINSLKSHSELVAICHPKFTNFLTYKDMEKLSNYALIEVVSGMAHSSSYWDAALSAGRLSFAVGNDDSHDMTNIFDYSKACTMIYVDSISNKNVYKSLYEGAAFAIEIPMVSDSTHRMTLSREVYEKINEISLKDDTIVVSLNHVASHVEFVGQNGEIKEKFNNVNVAKYHFKTEDTYIRLQIEFGKGLIFYLNPFLRYDSSIEEYRDLNKIDYLKSTIYWTICFLILSFLGYRLYKRGKRIYRRLEIKRRWYND